MMETQYQFFLFLTTLLYNSYFGQLISNFLVEYEEERCEKKFLYAFSMVDLFWAIVVCISMSLLVNGMMETDSKHCTQQNALF